MHRLGCAYAVFATTIYQVFLDVPFPYSEGPRGLTVKHFMRCLVRIGYVYMQSLPSRLIISPSPNRMYRKKSSSGLASRMKSKSVGITKMISRIFLMTVWHLLRRLSLLWGFGGALNSWIWNEFDTCRSPESDCQWNRSRKHFIKKGDYTTGDHWNR